MQDQNPSGGRVVYHSEPAIKLPEYGRLIQSMAEAALKMPARQDRQTYANLIVRLMKKLTEQPQNDSEFEKKLWNHLAYITNYQLDIDWPYPIVRHDTPTAPTKMAYPQRGNRMRRYGQLVERWLGELATMPEGPKRDELVRLIASRMKRSTAEERTQTDSDERIAHDIALYTDGAIRPDFSHNRLPDFKTQKKGKNK